jgi:hypothetical protein
VGRMTEPDAHRDGLTVADGMVSHRKRLPLAATMGDGTQSSEPTASLWACCASRPVMGASALTRTSPTAPCELEARWPSARRNKIKVSARLSVKTVHARAYFAFVTLARARVARPALAACGDGT